MLRKRKAATEKIDPTLPTLIDDEAYSLRTPAERAIADAGQRGDVAAIIAGLSAASDWTEMVGLAEEALGDDLQQLPGWLTSWYAAQPDELMVRRIMGYALVLHAWAVRGGGRAETVSQDQFHEFWRILRQAEMFCEDAVRAQPANGLAWSGLLAAGRGLQLDKDESNRLFMRCHAQLPFFSVACGMHLQTLCRKWQGSHDDCMAFARWLSANVPQGDLLHSFVAAALVEITADDNKAVSPSVVRPELRTAFERSGLADPNWRTDRAGVSARNQFAAAAWFLDDSELAQLMFRQIGPVKQRIKGPWVFSNEVGQQRFLRYGREVGAW